MLIGLYAARRVLPSSLQSASPTAPASSRYTVFRDPPETDFRKTTLRASPTSQSPDASGSLGMLHRIRKRQVSPPGQDDRLLDDVAQLAYIPRPTPAFQDTAVFRRKILNAFPMMPVRKKMQIVAGNGEIRPCVRAAEGFSGLITAMR